jgi:hypothetical protein
MRYVVLTGAAILALGLGAASAFANGPNSSPYEIMTFSSAQQPLAPLETPLLIRRSMIEAAIRAAS